MPVTTSSFGNLLIAGLALTASLIVPACGPPRLPPGPYSLDDADPDTRRGCSLVVEKCSRCHEIERIGIYRARSPGQWASLVTRMRRQRGSDIDETEGELITSCLVTRQFGPSGQEQWKRETQDADGSEGDRAPDPEAEQGGQP